MERVSYIYDGDTFITNNNQKIRLSGIDCPEKGQPYYEEAKEKLEELMPIMSAMQIESISMDKYGRILANVYYQDKWINYELVKAGLALVFDVTNNPILTEAQNIAQENKLNFWSQNNPNQ